MNIFNIFSVFDYITPIVETVKDVAYIAETGEIGSPITLGDDDIGYAVQIINEFGYRVISTTQAPLFQSDGYIDVPAEQREDIISILRQHRIFCY